MTQQEKYDVQLALDNEWSDRLFHYYKTFIKAAAIRSEYDDAQEWYKLKSELRAKINESKVVLGPELVKTKIKVK
jgi:predicted ATPase